MVLPLSIKGEQGKRANEAIDSPTVLGIHINLIFDHPSFLITLLLFLCQFVLTCMI